MKYNTAKRHLREGSKNIFRNGWMTIASIGAVTVTLILVGVFLAVVFNLNQFASNIESDVEMSVYLDPTLAEDQVQSIQDQLESIDKVGSVTYSSKEEQLNQLMEDMGQTEWDLFEQDNPLSDTYIVKTSDPHDIASVSDEISKLDGIDKVDYGQGTVENLFAVNKYARIIGAVLIVGLVFTAIFLISNTIKITIIARSREIGIMKLVGATNSFIRWPFFIEGLLLGVLGAIVPVALVLGGYYYLSNNLTDNISIGFVEILPYAPFAFQLAGILLAIGAVIGVWGSVMSVRKFLKV
ncbi:permease-like cell division protein FtsX [Terribacillus saccharophilus]|uniref:Cell division protein FtsX n=1 Tax=Terribacillus saccharophilus TaxID=361277 RepID=A0A268AF87_9BACI|nr:permease-like cell division protein FtsX [Terribacillus saccharophilus]PAD22780.1 cell division protein FtsX [Terribacillus saccharophilus]PAF18075.1 cell division protein FtsX [Terribacillus saccharophilus]PAF22715.1 cell division protein FtsX [Terribacillus saccharophilus]PAF35035.1 cell division protein FtsX [Terribacillus saccharophilus]PAF37358.1 cell division protein FtsX [Terribacillus saccharophilus]